MRIMGLDIGDSRIGVALSDELGWTAQGFTVIERGSEGDTMSRIEAIVRQYDVSEIVIGLPKNMDGSIGPRARVCMEFAEALRERLNLSVHLRDERLTTVSAQRTLLEADVSRKKRKRVIDKIAAAFILQNYLDANKKK